MATVDQVLSARPLREQDVLAWLNYELIPWTTQVRRALNAEFTLAVKQTTAATGVLTTIFSSSAMPPGSAWSVNLTVTAISPTGTDALRFDATMLYSRAAGNAILQGSTGPVVLSAGAGASWNVAAGVSGQGFVVQVVDDGVTHVDWVAHVSIKEAT